MNKEIKGLIDSLMKPVRLSILKNLEKSIGGILQSHTQQVVLCILEFIFLDDHLPLEITTTDFTKTLCAYTEKIKKHFQANKDHQLINVLSKSAIRSLADKSAFANRSWSNYKKASSILMMRTCTLASRSRRLTKRPNTWQIQTCVIKRSWIPSLRRTSKFRT